MDIFILMLVLFVLGYTAIALEHPLKVNKAPTALFMGMILWIIYAFFNEKILALGYSPSFKIFEGVRDAINANSSTVSSLSEKVQKFFEELAALATNNPDHNGYMEFVKHELGEHLNDVGQILFFLLGAMTIVETVDRYQGFRIITDGIKTKSPVKLMWILSFLTFFMSALLDNLTTTIVMIALLRKLVHDKHMRWFFASMIVIAANAGGAWSPIGDVTTIMLWIGGQVTTLKIIAGVFLPSLTTMVIPLLFVSMMLKGKTLAEADEETKAKMQKNEFTTKKERLTMLILGVGGLLFVPVLKTITHLPPYVGMLLSLSVVWITTEIIVRNKSREDRRELSVIKILEKVDVPTIFFFLGILMAVAALESAGHLDLLAKWLDDVTNTNYYVIDTAIGLLSSIVDNVPLTASAMGMYPIETAGHLAQDGLFWELLAYTAGTGGSILIIGSAAGVAAMGLEKIDFIWYAKKISWLAAIGYFSGILIYWLQETFFHILG